MSGTITHSTCSLTPRLQSSLQGRTTMSSDKVAAHSFLAIWHCNESSHHSMCLAVTKLVKDIASIIVWRQIIVFFPHENEFQFAVRGPPKTCSCQQSEHILYRVATCRCMIGGGGECQLYDSPSLEVDSLVCNSHQNRELKTSFPVVLWNKASSIVTEKLPNAFWFRRVMRCGSAKHANFEKDVSKKCLPPSETCVGLRRLYLLYWSYDLNVI